MIVFLLGIVLVMGSTLLFSILKGGTKTEVIKEVKQNGNFVMATMTRMIRNAKEASCDPAKEWVTITSTHDDLSTTFVCLDVGSENGKIASNTARLTNENVKVDACSIDCEGTSPETVTISFTLSQKGTPSRVEEQARQDFQTTVSLRTY